MPHRFEADGYRDLLPSLEGHFASLLARHKEAAGKTAWSYPQFLPLEAFRANAIEQPTLSATAYLAVETALLTEVNLPWYTAGLSRGLESCPGPIQEFVRVWTSEEDQHATLLESYLLLTGGGDHAARARSRKAMIAGGWSHTLAGPFEGMVYTAMQEAATRTFYLCAARACGEESPTLAAALRRIAKDETLHMAFYRDVVKAHLDLDSNYLRPLAAVMLRFEMPWAASVLRDFEERRALLSARGVFRLSDYLDEVVQPLWAYWGLEGRTLEREETRRAFVQLRRYRAALRKFARSETRPAGDSMSSKDARLLVAT
ncbi:MAG: acyl-ACP desaturase [Deltaproteobacteria bacterium]|nr:MAG: acyl-ACP desaturase [Deltaproteobacteria bacterium]